MNKFYLDELCSVIAKVRTKKQALSLLKDILTSKELKEVAERWQIVKKLVGGEPHRKISKSLKVSISKVTRGSKALKHDHGAFSRYLRPKRS